VGLSREKEINSCILREKLSPENEYLYFYKNMYNAFEKLNWVYKNGYDHNKIIYNISKDGSISSSSKEIIEYSSIVPCILSLLIGLNREKLQNTNSQISNQGLFQYVGYESDAPLSGYDDKYKVNDMDKAMCKHLKFNPTMSGPFPYILEINVSDGRVRPYDCMTKIRNALEHAEYVLKKGEVHILNITNHDDLGNVSFEGRLLEWSFRHFIEDYYGIGLGVSSSMYIYENPNYLAFFSKEKLEEFLKNSSCTSINFTNIPDNLKFSGKSALFSKLNSAFTYGGLEKDDFNQLLDTLKNNGLQLTTSICNLSQDEINNLIKFLQNKYGESLYRNPNRIMEVSNIFKLNYSFGEEVANCVNNILRYIDFREHYLIYNEFPNDDIFKEQIGDEQVDFTFKITMLLIKINLVNYLIECNEFELPDLSKIDVSNIIIDSPTELSIKVNNAINDGIDPTYAKEYVILNTIRNAMAHGGERIKIIFDEEPSIQFSDIYNNKIFKVIVTLKDLEKIYNNEIFAPDNQKIVNKNKNFII